MRIRQRTRRGNPNPYPVAVLLVWIFPTIIAFIPLTGQRKIPSIQRERTNTNTNTNNDRCYSPPLTILYYEYEDQMVQVASDAPPTLTPSPRKRIRRKNWDDMIPKLRAFREKHGHVKVTREHKDQELYEWVRNIRYNYLHQVRNDTDTTGNRRRLTTQKLQTLNDLDFYWGTKRKANRWDTMFQRLKEFQQTQNHTRVTLADDGDAELYEWTKYLRYTYRHQALNQTSTSTTSPNKKTNYVRPRLSPAKFQALKDIDFDWTHNIQRKVSRWQVMLPRLVEFKKIHGHTRVTLADDDAELYQWTRSLTRNYGHQLFPKKNGKNSSAVKGFRWLSPLKLQKLQDMDFSGQTRSTMWERRFQELRTYYKDHGHCHVPSREYPQLGVFVQNQRQEYRRYLAGNATTLTSERIDSLQRIQFSWAKSQELSWQERRDDLEHYRQGTGHADVPQDFATNLPLGQWCMNQRRDYRYKAAGEQTGMSQERIRELEKLEFRWNYRQAQWNHMLERMRRYQQDHGHFEIRTSDSRNNDLRQWLNEQRHYYKTNHTSRSTPERVEALESIPDFSWRPRRESGPSKDDWSDLFVAIKEKGIKPGGRAKTHLFDGVHPFQNEVKTEWSEQDIKALWDEEGEDEDEDGYFEDEESRLFLTS